ncbi:MAG: hypothetical protein ACXW3F_06110 [Pyrinomonadaceae bacterium]
MKAHYFSQKIGRVVAALFFVISIGFVSSSAVQAQRWPNATGQRNRDYRREQERQVRRDRERQRNDQERVRNEEWRRRNRNRNDDDGRYRGNSGYGNNGNISQAAVNRGYQDGTYTGSRDAQRGQSYNPQRSHFYKNGHGDNGGYGSYGNSYQYQQAYRQGFLRGYDQGFRQYGGYNRSRSGTNNRSPFPW